MTDKEIRPFGTWPSQISAEMLSASIRLNDVQWARGSDILVWSQSFEGQTTLFAKPKDALPYPLTDENNKPSGGIAYGGGEFFAAEDGVIFTDRDGRLYRKSYQDGAPQAITPGFGSAATPVLSHNKDFVIYAHSYDGIDRLAATRADGKTWPVILQEGADFYLNPCLSPDDRHLAWIEWNHPNMPWDGTSLKIAKLDPQSLSLSEIQTLDGFGEYACYQVSFSPCGNFLAWLANTGEFDDLIVYDLRTKSKLTFISQKSLLQPAWIAGQHTLAWAPDSLAIYYIDNDLGTLSLKKLNLLKRHSEKNAITTVDIGDFTWLDQLSVSARGEIAFIAQSSAEDSQIVRLHPDGTDIIFKSRAEALPAGYFAIASPFSWQSSDGVEVHGFYYPPTNPDYTAEGLPPVITIIHGGPTSANYNDFDMSTAFFTSRGYAVFKLNYRGSTGFGKSYRNALQNNWGKIDLQDAIEGTQALIDAGLADPSNLVIMGGSAGGFTVLNALIHHPSFFKLGISRYGVSNLFMLEEDTHKFESHYNTSLLGALPEHHDEWQARSPVFHADKIRDALLLFQGSADPVVPQAQSDSLVEQLKANNVPHLYRVYEGEGHGFRQAENLIDYYNTIDACLKEMVIGNSTSEE
ncbi:MAG TPA: prolyl oligopeptidase family serine peptidase [Anaerolineaceae bacterium]|nr:prolyl oligopeptidase family serine peptidase [Anaerolineaceae bacterium]HQC63769.1 prolyl oligopeptidase family serine peptidase [Anaerolineaceae bacterium]